MLGGAAVSASGMSGLLAGCTGGLATYRARVTEDAIEIARHEVPQLQVANGILIVHAAGVPGSIILRNMEQEGIVALSSVCTHRGCEVRPRPDSLECPCHGSEYDEFGEVLQGPARQPLRRFSVVEKQDKYVIDLT